MTEPSLDDSQVFELIGEAGFSRLAHNFYQRVANDDLLHPMYPEQDLAGAEQRLRDFLIFRFGGPPTYIEQRGHPRLRMRHAPFRIDQRARDRWIQLMDEALQQSALPEACTIVLRRFFDSAATFMINTSPT